MFLAEMSAPRWVLMGVIVKLAQSVSVISFPSLSFLSCLGHAARDSLFRFRGRAEELLVLPNFAGRFTHAVILLLYLGWST